MTRLILGLFVCLAIGSPAQAQIYAWRDAKGAQVYSDRPRTDWAAPGRRPADRAEPGGRPADRAGPGPSEIVTFAVSGTSGVRATKPAAPKAAGRFDGRFDDIIQRHATTSGISPDLIRAVIQVESGFNPAAVSPKGAQGLMQLMPGTARDLGVVNPFHPEENIRGGVAYLKQLLGQYSQDVRLALAAYNAGPASVARYGDVPPYRETQAYVKKITAAAPQRAAVVRGGGPQVYKWVEIVDGRPVPRYSNVPPVGHAFEVIGRR